MKSVKSIFAVAITLLFATSCQDESVSPAREQNTNAIKNTHIMANEVDKVTGLSKVTQDESPKDEN